MPRKPIGFLPG